MGESLSDRRRMKPALTEKNFDTRIFFFAAVVLCTYDGRHKTD